MSPFVAYVLPTDKSSVNAVIEINLNFMSYTSVSYIVINNYMANLAHCQAFYMKCVFSSMKRINKNNKLNIITIYYIFDVYTVL